MNAIEIAYKKKMESALARARLFGPPVATIAFRNSRVVPWHFRNRWLNKGS